MQIVSNRALKLRLRSPERVLDIIPKSAELSRGVNGSEVLVHWDLDNATVLKNLGIKNVPSPILGQYKWPGMFPPMEHQKLTASFLSMHRRAYCLSEQGTGKTMASIWAADYLMELGVIEKVLIICPMSTMQTAWQADLFKTVMHRTVGIAHGSRDVRRAVIGNRPDYVIINPDGVGTVINELRKAKFDLIILDEATCVKNASTSRWKVINSLMRPDMWLWMLTGTPAAQSPVDAYGLARMMDPSTAPRSMSSWRDEVMYKVTNFKWVPRKGWMDKVYDLLQPAIRFTKDQCMDLPPKTYVTREVPMSKVQEEAYNTLREQLAMALEGEMVTAVNAASGMSKLLQISSGSVYTDEGETLDFDISARFKELCEIIDASPNKVLVFVPFVNAIERLSSALEAKGYTAAVIRGGVSLNKRNQIISDFQQEENPRVLVLQPSSISHGVTLHAADTSVWWGPVMSYETYAQANDRMHRKGQENPCTVIHLQSSPVEKLRFAALSRMQDDSEGLLEMYKEVLSTV